MTQTALTFVSAETAPQPTPSDPSIPVPARKRAIRCDRRLLALLLEGGSVYNDAALTALVGKRHSARLGDVRAWLRANGWEGGDPIPRRCVDAEAMRWSWRLSGPALEFARRILEG